MPILTEDIYLTAEDKERLFALDPNNPLSCDLFRFERVEDYEKESKSRHVKGTGVPEFLCQKDKASFELYGRVERLTNEEDGQKRNPDLRTYEKPDKTIWIDAKMSSGISFFDKKSNYFGDVKWYKLKYESVWLNGLSLHKSDYCDPVRGRHYGIKPRYDMLLSDFFWKLNFLAKLLIEQ
jgi:hypothetical protein